MKKMMKRVSSKTACLGAAAVLASLVATTGSVKAQAAEPYIGEIIATGVASFCPRGWAAAEGQLLAVSQNDALFSLLGTIYGGDGRTTFGLPDLRGRVPTHPGQGPGLSPVRLGQRDGNEQVALTQAQNAPHSHMVQATNLDGDKGGPKDKLLAAAPNRGVGQETIYSDQGPNVTMDSRMIGTTGNSQPFSTLDPSQTVRYCIALVGIYPSRS
ncbi:phage tail protein [Tateyamaria sp. syn59]|uniref:phage tail protein n=1 Tax=Tateyamaria sp. syn59 TaxID=2576942 RepID=UPI001CB960C6|nr:tail fiber protein [Tateyamaria sp. syn59]